MDKTLKSPDMEPLENTEIEQIRLMADLFEMAAVAKALYDALELHNTLGQTYFMAVRPDTGYISALQAVYKRLASKYNGHTEFYGDLATFFDINYKISLKRLETRLNTLSNAKDMKKYWLPNGGNGGGLHENE